MPTYKAPVSDTVFLLNDVFDYARYANAPGFAEAPIDVVEHVLTEGAKFVEEVVQPLNRIGDVEGCKRHEDGSVTTPKGFKEAYKALVEGGWVGLAGDPKYGGQGLPHFLAVAAQRIPDLGQPRLRHVPRPHQRRGRGDDGRTPATTLKDRYLPKMTTGEWTGTMNLTEPHCGTDLGLIKTKAVPQPDGSYAITGQKIFISAGEHDLADNIVHLVLARIEGAPAGVKGISLFVVPKFLPDANGAPGERNGVVCGSLEHKMGIHGNATAVLNYDGAKGWLIGEEHRGLPAMFVMMNGARLGVAVQGLALSEVAYQNAAAYAKERRQGRSLKGAGRAGQARRPPARPSRRAPHAARDPGVQRGGARPARLGGADAGGGADRARPEGPPGRRRPARPADAGDQGRVHRHRLRQRGQGAAGVRRPRLHRPVGHGAVRSRRPHRHDLRGRQRRAGARSRRPQAAQGRRPRHHGASSARSAQFLAANKDDAALAPYLAAVQDGARPSAAGDDVAVEERPRRSRTTPAPPRTTTCISSA